MLLLIDFGLKSLLGRLLAEDILEEEREREATRIKADISSPAADRTLRGETGPHFKPQISAYFRVYKRSYSLLLHYGARV